MPAFIHSTHPWSRMAVLHPQDRSRVPVHCPAFTLHPGHGFLGVTERRANCRRTPQENRRCQEGEECGRSSTPGCHGYRQRKRKLHPLEWVFSNLFEESREFDEDEIPGCKHSRSTGERELCEKQGGKSTSVDSKTQASKAHTLNKHGGSLVDESVNEVEKEGLKDRLTIPIPPSFESLQSIGKPETIPDINLSTWPTDNPKTSSYYDSSKPQNDNSSDGSSSTNSGNESSTTLDDKPSTSSNYNPSTSSNVNHVLNTQVIGESSELLKNLAIKRNVLKKTLELLENQISHLEQEDIEEKDLEGKDDERIGNTDE